VTLLPRSPISVKTGRGEELLIDESGEDYLYPSDHFGEIELPRRIAKAITPSPRRRSRS